MTCCGAARAAPDTAEPLGAAAGSKRHADGEPDADGSTSCQRPDAGGGVADTPAGPSGADAVVQAAAGAAGAEAHGATPVPPFQGARDCTLLTVARCALPAPPVKLAPARAGRGRALRASEVEAAASSCSPPSPPFPFPPPPPPMPRGSGGRRGHGWGVGGRGRALRRGCGRMRAG